MRRLLTSTPFLLAAVILFGILSRFWGLGFVPEGFYSDEALYGYEAYSLLKTGKDQFGNSWPLSIAGFGDYRPALYIYSTIPFVALFGLTEFATRLPSALFSLISIPLLFIVVRLVTKSEKIALLSAFSLAVAPQSIFLGRMAHETNLMTMLILGGIFFLCWARRHPYSLLLSPILFAGSLYTYHSARVFVPLFLIFTLWFQRHQIRSNMRLILLTFFVGVVVSLPFLQEMTSSSSWSRVASIGLWNDQGTILKINEMRGNLEALGLPSTAARLVSNKASVFPFVFAKNVLSHFSPDFLLIHGDPNGIYNTPRVGTLLWMEALGLLIGTIYVLKTERRVGIWALVCLILTLIPDSLTRVAPSSPRIHLWVPFLYLMIGYGWYSLRNAHHYVRIAAVLFVSLNVWWFWHQYLVIRPLEHQRAWQMGTKEMITAAKDYSDQYEKIWISRSGWGWIHLLFHTQYDPSLFQKEAQVSPKNAEGFWWVQQVGNYTLEWLPERREDNSSTLYIAPPEEFPLEIEPIHRVYDQFGVVRFWFVPSYSIQAINK